MSTYESQTGHLSPRAFLQQRYMIIRQAGRGGMSAVYEAVDTREKRRVAVKEMSQGHLSRQELVTATARFQQEANLLGSLNHPNLPHIFDAFSEGGRSYVVMDFIEGKTLHQHLLAQPGQPLPLPQVLHYACQLCNVLIYLHQQKPPIIFRDMKPSNVMITPQGEVFLIDFGIARVFTEGKTQDTVQLGSPGYAPPEQHGSAQTNPRSDLFGLGATLHYCLTGNDPYYAEDHFSFIPVRQVNPQVPVELERLIQRMLAMDERQRPENANEVLQTLQQLTQRASQSTTEIRPAPAPSEAPTVYGMRPVTTPHLQATVLPIPPGAGGKPIQANIPTRPMQTRSALWSQGFSTLFVSLLVLSAMLSIAVMNTLYLMKDSFQHQLTGWAWILEFGLIGVISLFAFGGSFMTRQISARLLLLLVGLFTLISTILSLISGSFDLQDLLGVRASIGTLHIVALLCTALAALCSMGWQFLPAPRNAHIIQFVLMLVTIGCALAIMIPVITWANTTWHLLFQVGIIALLLNTALVARMGQFNANKQAAAPLSAAARSSR